jgi:hypothetical protein
VLKAAAQDAGKHMMRLRAWCRVIPRRTMTLMVASLSPVRSDASRIDRLCRSHKFSKYLPSADVVK